jgi:hypothetical protein
MTAWKDTVSSAHPPDGPSGPRPVASHHFAPVTRLSQRTSLGWLPVIVTLLGGVSGAIVGAVSLQRTHPDTGSMSTLAVGATASGVLAALFSFWLFSLLQVFVGAWWQAHRHGR